jgi:glucokinase
MGCQVLFLDLSWLYGQPVLQMGTLSDKNRMPAITDLPVLVYDVGGSHVSVARCQNDPRIVGSVSRASYPSILDPRDFFQFLYSLGVQASQSAKELAGAQLALPAPFDYETGISRMRHKFPYLYGVSLRKGLAPRFGWEPGQVRFLHDAAAFLLGEITAGAACGASRAVGITLGTGIGSAFALSGRLLTDGPGLPDGGEIWNLPFAEGILEDSLSSRAIQREYERRTGFNHEVECLAAAAPGDAAARETFIDFGTHLGQALRSILSPFAPDVVVLGGGISKAAPLFLPSAQRELHGLPFRLVVSAMPDRAALVGAAAAWFNDGRIAHESDLDSVSAPAPDDAL